MFCGTLSSTSEHQKRLFKAVRHNDEKTIEKLILRDNSLLSTHYNSYDNHNIFILACNDQHLMQNVTGATITKLIQLGANCTEPSSDDHWEAIHYAAINTNKDKLETILQHLNLEEANSLVYCSKHVPAKYPFCPDKNIPKSYSNNALSVLLKYGTRDRYFRECCLLLIRKGVSVHQADSNGVTPLELMKQEKELSDIIKSLEVNQQQEVSKSRTTFELIKRKNKQFFSLKLDKEEANAMDAATENFSSCTLLQMCCAKGLTKCVKYLLDSGASPNKTIQKNIHSPIMIAIKDDHEEIVKMILQNRDLVLPKDILIKLQVKYKNTKNFARIDKYMNLILKHLETINNSKLREYLAAKDELNRTALHYAVHYKCSENILQLLSMGASLTERDLFGYTPLNSMEPSLLEKFFDNCVGIPKDEEDVDNMLYALRNKKEKFSIEINYEALIPKNEHMEVYESEFLYQLIKVKSLTYLMNHPVISSYLAVKWTKYRWTVFVNLLMYLVAYTSLLFYGFAYDWYPEVSNRFLLASLILLFIRECVQMLILRSDYVKRIDNIIDLLLIAGIIYIIASGWFVKLKNQNLRVAFSVVFLTSTLGIFMQLGNLPFFTVKVIILRQISISFFKYMIFYVFPVLAFFFCFYMLRETTDDVFFQTLYDVITMFAGDPDSGYPAQFVTNPIFSHIIYVCFIVLIGIILQNLLIGLAVSDLQEIQKEAEFIDIKERANYIAKIEKVIFKKYRDASNWMFHRMFQKLLRLGSIFQDDRILVIQPYNYGCVYVKENPENTQYIRDQSIINLLQAIFKDISLDKENEVDSPYSLKIIHEKLEKIEKILERLDVDKLENLLERLDVSKL